MLSTGQPEEPPREPVVNQPPAVEESRTAVRIRNRPTADQGVLPNLNASDPPTGKQWRLDLLTM